MNNGECFLLNSYIQNSNLCFSSIKRIKHVSYSFKVNKKYETKSIGGFPFYPLPFFPGITSLSASGLDIDFHPKRSYSPLSQ